MEVKREVVLDCGELVVGEVFVVGNELIVVEAVV